jgi:hypothetical protein
MVDGEAGRAGLEFWISSSVSVLQEIVRIDVDEARTTMMMARTRSVRVATAVCLLLLLAATTASSAREAAHVESRDLLAAEVAGSPPVALSDEKPPDGHLSYRIVKGILEKYVLYPA